jgi:Tfp pilus assembly protein PilN
MIKVNLLERKKKTQLPTVLGLDLNSISLKGIVLAIMVAYLPDLFLVDRWEEQIVEEQAILNSKNKELKRIRAEIKKKENLALMIQKFIEREKELKNLLKVVEKVLESRKNPWNILKYVTNNIPKEVWLVNLKIEGDMLDVQGESNGFRPIGLFLENLKNSVFFVKDYPKIIDSQTKENSEYGMRTESFHISGRIKRYD